jgi:transposase
MAKKDKQALWARRIAACERSGMSRRAWCTAQGVNVHTLDYWRYRLRAAGTKAPAKRRRRNEQQALVPLQVVGAASSDGAIELHHGEWRLRLPRNVEVEWMAALLRAVASC